ncbi:MAG: ComEC family competence protein [Cyclobacteriaceae bacterium]|nr:ComEC family competence protein [Cyclobacteriaceae bacterium]
MLRWLPFVFVRVVIFFIAGILLGIYQPDYISLGTALVSIVLLTLIYIVIYFIQHFLHREKLNVGVIALPVIFLLGYVHLLWKTDSRQRDHILHCQDSIHFYRVVITDVAEDKDRSWKMDARVMDVRLKDWERYSGNVMLYFSKDNFAEPFRYGDVLLIKGSPRLVSPPSNPGEFDYKRFLSFRKIYHQQFLRKPEVMFLENDPPSNMMAAAIAVRSWAETTLKKYIHGHREQAIALALVLGVKDGLDNEVLRAYAATGAMHVLAVSGLHVGIIYFLIAFVLKPLIRSVSGKWVLAFISILFLWCYAFITGLSPSVLRAVTMFSLMALAKPWNRNASIYNTLGVAAFMLLVYEPYLIMSVGFQLSFLAVLGIVYLQPLLSTFWEPRHFMAVKIWEVSCVSMAAQIATFSVGLLYFHQFPNYFLFSNLFVIPGAFSVLVMGLAVLVFSFVQPIASGVGFLLEVLIRILNTIVFIVESFPFSLIENIHITTVQCWLLMGVSLTLKLLFQYKKIKFLWMAFGLALVFSSLQWQHFIRQANEAKVTIYRVPGHSAIDLMDRGRVIYLIDSALADNAEKLRFHIRPNRLQSGISVIRSGEQQEIAQQFSGCQLIHWNGISILQIQKRDFFVPENLAIDLLIISHNSVENLEKLVKDVTASEIILDSSNSSYFAERLLRQGVTHKIKIVSVLHAGAFEWQLN